MRTTTRHPRLLTAAFAAMWVLVAFHAAHALLGFGGAGMAAVAKSWIYTAAEVLAVAICAARVWARREDRWAWALIAFGLLTWTAGDLVWTLWLNNLANPPFPSIADPLYLAMYPAMYAALMLLIRSRRGRVSAEQWLDGGMVALALASVGTGLILPAVLQISQGRFIEDAVNLAYPLGDVTLLVFVVVAFALSSWRPDRVWLCLGAAMMLDAVADLLFTYLEAKGTYVAGGILDTLWPAAMALLAVAAWQPPKRRATQPVASVQVIVLPLAFAALALGILVDAAFTRITPTAVALAAGSLIVGIVRAVLTFMENIRMLRDSDEDAMTDGLSGLGNRRRLMRDLETPSPTPTSTTPRRWCSSISTGSSATTTPSATPPGTRCWPGSGPPARGCRRPRRAYRLGGDEFCSPAGGTVRHRGPADRRRHRCPHRAGNLFSVSASRGLAIVPDEAATATRAAPARRPAHVRRQGPRAAARAAHPRRAHAGARGAHARPARSRLRSRPAGPRPRARLRPRRRPARRAAARRRAARRRQARRSRTRSCEKPGPLDDDEWQLMRQHPAIGERILNADPVMQPVARLVRASHERWDGTGYPDGLAGTAIPLGARIIAACDALDAMTSDRCYQPRARCPRPSRSCAGARGRSSIPTSSPRCARAWTRRSPRSPASPVSPSPEGADDPACSRMVSSPSSPGWRPNPQYMATPKSEM